MAEKLVTETGDNIEVNTTDRHTGEGLDRLELEVDTKYGYGLICLNEKEVKALRDLLSEWCDG